MHPIISIHNLSISFSKNICFEDFSCDVYSGQRIAVIGRNGSGKSSLLKLIAGLLEPESGSVKREESTRVAYIPQIQDSDAGRSGGERFNDALTEAISQDPDVLLLDEPTNHLDSHHRKSLIRMLQRFSGSIIMATHDLEVLRTCVDSLWHTHQGAVNVCHGSYDAYMSEVSQKRMSIEKDLASLKRDKKDTHQTLMKEQSRAKKRKEYGEKKYEGDRLALQGARARGQMTSNKNNKRIRDTKEDLIGQLSELYIPEVITPKFSLCAESTHSGSLISVHDASIGYQQDNPILKEINFSMGGRDRIAILGGNGSGKSTFLKSVLGGSEVFRTGTWNLPQKEWIGYLDQHYANLTYNQSIREHVQNLRPDWHETEIRCHLNDFLFRKNEEVEKLAGNLSGGERARLSLACMAAKTPRLLVLDEITNNLDLETREHVVEVMKQYPGAILLVSHDELFLEEIGVDSTYEVVERCLVRT